jgi:cobyrinic acid a,c-diamide synthase
MTRALLIAGPASGQGKTSLTCALARRLRAQGQRVRAFKIGPDFIDPGFLLEATNAPVRNLDLWMVGEAECRRELARAAAQADWLLVEGAMGLFDGTPSTADLAARLNLPVLVVIDASAMAETFGALALGLQTHGHTRGLHVVGVMANRVASPGHARMLAGSLPQALPWWGHLGRATSALPERHLGLVQAQELQAGLDHAWAALDAALVLNTDPLQALPAWQPPPLEAGPPIEPLLAGHRIAVARDAAFSFCYEANLDVLRALGAEVQTFSPLADDAVPEGTDAVYLPGGYPELHAAALATCHRFMRSLRAHHAQGRPIVAECGGMMVCCRVLRTLDGQDHPMAGLLDATAVMSERLAGIGLHHWDSPLGSLRGHVFHYARLEVGPTLRPADLTQPRRYGGPEAIYQQGRLTASFFHGYFASAPEVVGGLFERRQGTASPNSRGGGPHRRLLASSIASQINAAPSSTLGVGRLMRSPFT